jgi:Tetracyclin repressor-like, C-terminal domain
MYLRCCGSSDVATGEIGPEVIHGLMTELHELPASVIQVIPGVMTTILRRAAERGEVSLDKVTPRIASLPGDLLRHQLLITRAPVSDTFLAEITDEIFLPLVTTNRAKPGRQASRRS